MKYLNLFFCLTVTTTIVYSMEPDPFSVLLKASELRAFERALEEDYQASAAHYFQMGNRFGLKRPLSAQKAERKREQNRACARRHYYKVRTKYKCPVHDPKCKNAVLPYPSWVRAHMQRTHRITISLIETYEILKISAANNTPQEIEIVLQPDDKETVRGTYV